MDLSNLQLHELIKSLGRYVKPHPWHGIPLRDKDAAEDQVNVYVEIVPSDSVKFELDKNTGYLKVDRPQKFSNYVPCMYGLVPQTYCAEAVAKFTNDVTGRNLQGDMDPLDICVLSEKNFSHGDILVNARVVGGFRMIDGGEADDKLVAVLNDDAFYGDVKDISELPKKVVDRLIHYFMTYKEIPSPGKEAKVEIESTYGRDVALKVLKYSSEDYFKHYGV